MMRGLIAGLALLAMLGGVATASPLKIRNGSTVRVALQGKREAGVGLRMHGGGWQLELAPLAGAVADVFDVTEGAMGGKWTVEVEDGVVFFDQETFIAGHAYRVMVRRGSEWLGTTLVYSVRAVGGDAAQGHLRRRRRERRARRRSGRHQEADALVVAVFEGGSVAA